MRRLRSLIQGLPGDAGTWHAEPKKRRKSITPADLAGLFRFRVNPN